MHLLPVSPSSPVNPLTVFIIRITKIDMNISCKMKFFCPFTDSEFVNEQSLLKKKDSCVHGIGIRYMKTAI